MSSSATPATGLGAQSKKISSACTACQNRKSKCTGGIPCDKCRLRSTNCVFDQAADGRTKVALKRKQQDLEDDRDLLLQLVETLRDSDEQNVAQLVNVIRSNATLQEIKTCIDNPVDRAEQSGSKSPGVAGHLAEGSRAHTQGSGIVRRRVMDMNRLVDSPVINVPASPWTTVTNDTHLISHLVSLWFTWSAPWQNWIVRPLFVQDMQSENLEAPYCSPFLVNAMLAHACPYSDYPEARTTNTGMSELMEQFLAEAKRLLDQEAGRASLATVQGLGILCQCVSSMGKDRLGWIYMRQLVAMLDDLKRGDTTKSGWTEEASEIMSRAIDYTCWGLWTATTTSCFAWHRPPVMELPHCPKPRFAAHNTEIDAWTPYPEDQPSVPGHAQCLSGIFIDLMSVVHDAAVYLFGPVRPTDPDSFRTNIIALHTRVEIWYNSLPACLAVSYKAPFQVLFPHLYYHHLNIVLSSYLKDFNFVEQVTEGSSTSPASLKAYSICAHSACEIARLLEMHRTVYGISRICDSTMLWTASALFALLDENLGVEKYKCAFVDLCIFARSLSRRWILGKGILRLIQLTARRKQLRVRHSILPSETEKLFEDFENSSWTLSASDETSTSLRAEFSSFYPNLAESVKKARQEFAPISDGQAVQVADFRGKQRQPKSIKESPPVIEMDHFLEMYDSLLISNVSLTDSAASNPNIQPAPQ